MKMVLAVQAEELFLHPPPALASALEQVCEHLAGCPMRSEARWEGEKLRVNV